VHSRRHGLVLVAHFPRAYQTQSLSPAGELTAVKVGLNALHAGRQSGGH